MSKPSLMADTNDVFDQKPSNKYWVDVQVGRQGGTQRRSRTRLLFSAAVQACVGAPMLLKDDAQSCLCLSRAAALGRLRQPRH